MNLKKKIFKKKIYETRKLISIPSETKQNKTEMKMCLEFLKTLLKYHICKQFQCRISLFLPSNQEK